MVTIREITLPNEKSHICELVLRALPDWFGNEESLIDYVQKVKTMPFFAAFDNIDPIGFVAIKVHNPHTAEICVMGILMNYHRGGIGRFFVERCEQFCVHHRLEFLTVKTLADTAESEEYAGTRQFYQAMGFIPLEVFPTLWDAANPCLFLAKNVGNHK